MACQPLVEPSFYIYTWPNCVIYYIFIFFVKFCCLTSVIFIKNKLHKLPGMASASTLEVEEEELKVIFLAS